MATTSRRRVRLLVAGTLALGLLLAGLLGWRKPRPGPAPETAAAREPSLAARARLPRLSAELRPATPPGAQDPHLPIIDEVRLEKGEVCDGEENLVTVKAHTPENADDAFLHALVDGQPGTSVVLRASADQGTRSNAQVVVFGRNGTFATADVPPFVVKDCKVPWKLLLTFRMLPNRAGTFELGARVVPHGASQPFQATRYLWTFGDETGSETIQPFETHDFSRRPQRAMVSMFLVTCVAVDASGERVTGRVALQLNNLAFETFVTKGVVLIAAEPDPLFPTLGDDGLVSQRVRLWHSYERSVHIQRLRRSPLVIGRPAGAPQELSVERLGVESIAPGEAAQSKAMVLDTRSEPDVYSVEYLIEGVTEDGWPARGNFAVMRPPPPPTRESHTPVNDPALKARIVRARQLLNKEVVTDEDIWRLEREGQLSDLR
jgi:hypothetical protein